MKVLVVDDHTLIREALRNVLRELDASSVVIEAPDGEGALEAARREGDIDLVLLDLNLPDMDGLFALGVLRRKHPATAVVVLSGIRDPATVLTAIDLGAVGFIPKSTSHAVMLEALRLVCAGGTYLPADLLVERALLEPRPGAELDLTAREAQVLALMLEGKPNKVISRDLGVAEATVKNHVTAVLKALKATNRTQAVIAAGRLNWKPPYSPG